MNRVLARLRRSGPGRRWAGTGTAAPGRLDRNDIALGRLRAARAGFDDSVVALRKAALDHVDVQDLASTAIRANLDRLARSLGRELIEADACLAPGIARPGIVRDA